MVKKLSTYKVYTEKVIKIKWLHVVMAKIINLLRFKISFSLKLDMECIVCKGGNSSRSTSVTDNLNMQTRKTLSLCKLSCFSHSSQHLFEVCHIETK